MDYLTYKGQKLPIRVSYYAIKQYQIETGKTIDSIDENISNLEILLYYAIIAGCRAEGKEVSIKREDMEFILDEELPTFNRILTGSFPEATSTPGATKSKKK